MTSNLGPIQVVQPTFKKRSLRPWRPALSLDDFRPAEIHTELLQKQLDASLEAKTKQQEVLQAQLSLLEDSSVRVGGFFQPGNLLAAQLKEFFQNTQGILGELKEKEHEISTITQQLQLTQAQEEARRAQVEWQAEATARQSAEMQALAALQQMQEALERAEQAQDKIDHLDYLKTQLEQTVFGLEEKLKVSHENQATTLQAMEQRLATEREGKQLEASLRKHLQDELNLSEQRLYTLEQQLDEKSNEVSSILQRLNREQQARIHEVEHRKQIEQELQASVEKLVILHEKIEQTLLLQRQLLQEQANSKETLLDLQQHAHKLNSVIESERALRTLVEAQVREMAAQHFSLEMRLKTAEYARQAVEKKNKQLVERVSQAVLQVLETA